MKYFIFYSNDFRKSLRKIVKSGICDLDSIEFVLNKIANRDVLDVKYKDHQLKGKMSELRECHIKSDLLLVYEIKNEIVTVVAVDIGTHSQLFR